MTTPGKVYLIGAGPGDVELLTIKAVKALALADVVLLDALVNQDVLQYAKPNATVVNVGKRGGCKSTPQSVIEEQMISYALQGKCVARVKGGDPFIFGRGGEEVMSLEAAGIDVEIISGITSGIAAAAVLRIPLTHRDYSHGITFITGHCQNNTQPDWHKLANNGTTLVIYMGMKNLPSIVDNLLLAGMSNSTPAAIIQSATCPGEKIVHTTLSQMLVDANEKQVASPAILIIGNVLKWPNDNFVLPQSQQLQEVG